jgi:hypothetical protein
MIRELKRLLILWGVLALPIVAQAAKVSLRATVDKTEASTEDAIVLTVSVEGTQSAPRPVLPAVEGFNIQYSGSSSEVRIVNGVMSSRIKHNYILFPLREGDFSIGPAYIDYEGQRIESQPIRLKILSAQAQPQENKPLFLKARVSNETPYYNEQVVYTLQFGRMVDLASASLDAPEFKDVWIEDLGEQKQYQRVIGGHTYLITEIKKALFLAKTGKITIGPATIRCEVVLKSRRHRSPFGDRLFDDFFSDAFGVHQTKTRILHSQPIELIVKPLPEQGKPPNFHPLVGQLELKTSSSKRILEVGDSTTLTLEVTGNVNIRDAQLINPSRLEDFKVYDDKPTLDITHQGDTVIGRKIFKKALVPQRAGQLKVPRFEIPYFDPETATYKVARSPVINLQVSPAAEKEKLHEVAATKVFTQKESIKLLGSDILPIYTDTEALRDNSLDRRDYIIYGAVFLLPGLAFLTLFSIRMRQLRHENDASLLRRKNAYKKAMKNLDTASSVLKDGNQSGFYAGVSKAIKEYLGDKLNLSGAALTPQEAEAKLETAGLNAELIERVKELMQQCESCQFGSMSTGQTECQAVFKDSKQILKQLEKVLRNNG